VGSDFSGGAGGAAIAKAEHHPRCIVAGVFFLDSFEWLGIEFRIAFRHQEQSY
jgi:hypothetical protein